MVSRAGPRLISMGPRPAGTIPTSPAVPRVPVVADLPSKVLSVKEGETFLYSDVEGNIDDRRGLGLGLYHRDTRYLSHFHMRVAGLDPVLLSSSADRTFMAHVDLTNHELLGEDGSGVPQNTLSIRRVRAISDRLYERVRIKNYNPFPVAVDVGFSFGSDFADIFEVRGLSRSIRGVHEPPRVEGGTVILAYHGRDDVRREARIELGGRVSGHEIRGDLVTLTVAVRLGPHETTQIPLNITPLDGQDSGDHRPFDGVVNQLRHSYDEWERGCTAITADNALFNGLLRRGIRDLRSLYTTVDGGGIIAAGIPWYVAVFGRDSLITAHQVLT